MINNRESNIRMIIHVAKSLGDLRKKVVFIGGCSVGLFITDNAMMLFLDIYHQIEPVRHDYPCLLNAWWK